MAVKGSVLEAAGRSLSGLERLCCFLTRHPLYCPGQGPWGTWHGGPSSPFLAIERGRFCSGADNVIMVGSR